MVGVKANYSLLNHPLVELFLAVHSKGHSQGFPIVQEVRLHQILLGKQATVQSCFGSCWSLPGSGWMLLEREVLCDSVLMVLTLKGVGTSLLRQLQLPLAAPPPQAHGKDEWKLGEKPQEKFCRPGGVIFHFLCFRTSHAFYKYLWDSFPLESAQVWRVGGEDG